MGPAVQRKKNRPCDYSSEDDSIAFVILYLYADQNLDCLARGCVRVRACVSMWSGCILVFSTNHVKSADDKTR